MKTKAEKKTKTRQVYLAPHVEVIEMAMEAVVMVGSGSGNAPSYPDKGNIFGSNTKRNSSTYNAGTAGEIEDMINDILTIEQ